MRKLLAAISLCWACSTALPQAQPAVIDSMKAKIAKASSDEERVELLGSLSKTLKYKACL